MNAKAPLFDLVTPIRRRRSRRAARAGWLLVLLGFCGFLSWAAWAPLDGGVALQGTVTSAGYRKVVQPVEPGVVTRIHVQDGDRVEAGQVLVDLDSRVARAEQDAAERQRVMTRAAVARLEAEQRGDLDVVFPEPLIDAANSDASLASVLALLLAIPPAWYVMTQLVEAVWAPDWIAVGTVSAVAILSAAAGGALVARAALSIPAARALNAGQA